MTVILIIRHSGFNLIRRGGEALATEATGTVGKDENIVLDDVELGDGGIQVTVDLRYRFKRVGVKRVKAVVEVNS